MARDLSAYFKGELFKPQSGEAYMVLLTFEHEDLEQPIRLTDSPMQLLPEAGVRGVVSNGEEYIALPMEITLPGEEEGQMPVARVSIDNIHRDITRIVRSINSPPAVTLSVVLSSDPDTVEINIGGFQLMNIVVTARVVEGELMMKRIDREQFPPDRFTPSMFPALF